MKTTAVRLYGPRDLRVETFELPPIGPDEALIKIVSDSLCTSSYKAVIQGSAHKRVPDDIAQNPVVIGHECCGEIVALGDNLKDSWQVGMRIVIQPALNLDYAEWSVGYSFPYIGGNMTYAVVPKIVLERNCMIAYKGDYYKGSLAEPIGCVLRAFKGMYHTDKNFVRTDGAKRGGKLAILGGAGPMGLAAVDVAINYAGSSLVVVTDIDEARLARAKKMFPPEFAEKKGVTLIYTNTKDVPDQVAHLQELAGGGFDDVLVMVPVAELVSVGEKILGYDGCLNFFAGPAVHRLDGVINMYRVHYDNIHILGTAGSVPEDTLDTLKLIEEEKLNPGIMVSHILGLRAVPEAVLAMDKATGAKKICYCHIDIPMVAIEDFAELGKNDPLFAALHEIVEANGGVWCGEAERYLLEHGPRLEA